MIMGVAVHTPPEGGTVVEIVTELMQRGSLRDLIASEKWDSSTCFLLRLAVDAGHGLAFLHGRQPAVVHCDVKSPNVLVTQDWRGKVGGACSLACLPP